jgi:hypothetical protein
MHSRIQTYAVICNFSEEGNAELPTVAKGLRNFCAI